MRAGFEAKQSPDNRINAFASRRELARLAKLGRISEQLGRWRMDESNDPLDDLVYRDARRDSRRASRRDARRVQRPHANPDAANEHI